MKKLLLLFVFIISAFWISFASVDINNWWSNWDAWNNAGIEEAEPAVSDNWNDWWNDNWWWSTCIQLNTDVPGVWDCIDPNSASSSFWWLMWWLMHLLINFVIAVSFIALIASGVMIAMWWASQWTAWKWKELLKKVVIWIILLWLSWIILHTINPNFYKTSLDFNIVKNLN